MNLTTNQPSIEIYTLPPSPQYKVEDEEMGPVITVSNSTRGSIRSMWRRFVLQYWFYSMRYLTKDSLKSLFNTTEAAGNLYLVIWFILNIVITLASKSIFTDFNFPYPMLLTAIHLTFTGVGSELAAMLRTYPVTTISRRTIIKLIPFSLIFTVNIWCSNYSLLVASVTLHQVMRTCIPLITMLLSLVVYHERYPLRMLPAVAVVVVGVAITVWGDISMTLYGTLVVLAGCVLSSLKGLMSQKAQIGSEGLQTFDLLRVVCPMAVFQLAVCAILSGEVKGLASQTKITSSMIMGLLSQGLLAFALNVVSFKCAALKSPLTLNIAGNIKQVVTPFISFWLFGGKLTAALFIGTKTTMDFIRSGMNITLLGALLYGNEAQKHKTHVILPQEDPAESVEMIPNRIEEHPSSH